MLSQLLETSMNKHVKIAKNRCNNAVSARKPLTKQNVPVAAPAIPVRKTYQRSTVSRTVRVPNELVPRVNALIAAYRERLRHNPDTWTGG
jgi:hypothetical protein